MVSGEYVIKITYSQEGAHCRVFHQEQPIGECVGFEKASAIAQRHAEAK